MARSICSSRAELDVNQPAMVEICYHATRLVLVVAGMCSLLGVGCYTVEWDLLEVA